MADISPLPDPETIRAMDDKPLALIKCPIEREWIKAMFPARELLLAAWISSPGPFGVGRQETCPRLMGADPACR